MFQASVISGRSFKCNPDKEINLPSLLPGEENLRYDSIRGETGDSVVYMVYYNKKAYP